MKIFLLALAVSFLLAACGSRDFPTSEKQEGTHLDTAFADTCKPPTCYLDIRPPKGM